MKRIPFEPLDDPDFVQKTFDDPSWTYREKQDPLWMNLLLGGILVVCLILPFFLDPHLVANAHFWEVAAPIILLSCIPLVACMGGIRFDVSREKVVMRFGIVGFRILTIETKNIADIELATFRPMMDFGGWGVKWNHYHKVWGYFWSGNEGVFLTLKDGKRILLGSCTPKSLAEAIHMARLQSQ